MEKFQKPSILITVVYTLAYYLLILLWPTNSVGIGIMSVIGALIALTFLSITIYCIKEKEEKRFWSIVFIGFFCYLIGELIWRYHTNYLKTDYPFPGWANLFYNLFVLMYSIAVLYKIYIKKKGYRTIQSFFDSFIIMTVLTTITWVFFLSPLLQYPENSIFDIIISLSYPVAHLGILLGVVMLFFSSKSIFSPIVLKINATVMIIYTVAELFYLYETIYYKFNSSSPINPIWSICLILIGLSSFYTNKMKDIPPIDNRGIAKQVYRMYIILPYISITVLVILAIIKKEAMLSILIGGAVILFFITIRQVITIFENDSLVRQLKERTEELEITQLELMDLKEAAEEESWLKTKIAEIATMYPGIDNMETLAFLFITKITPMVGANYGVFYLKQSNGCEERFQKFAAYAYSQQEVGIESFGLGEGIIGQCALDNQMVLLNQIPENYIKISSALGTASPSEILIIPAEFQGEVLAVIELASFKTFSNLEQLLIKEIMSNLGTNIKSILSQMQVKKLLQESQALTEELQSQSKELQLQQEELRNVNEQLEEQFENSEQKTKELEKIKGILEEKAQQLTLSSQYKSEFLANMSHELRTPLNSMLILSQILAENSGGNLTSKQVNYVETIYSSGNDLLHLINDILDLAKVEAGKIEISIKEVELRDIKVFLESRFSPIARKKNIQFNIELASDLPEVIYTDKQRLEQILKNFLSNAFKFTESGGVSLLINKTKRAKLFNQSPSIYSDIDLEFSVKDTGIGISSEKLDIIFDAFKQADGKINRKYGGTGLGLSISRELSHLLGGFIEVESIEGIGSTFTLYLPNKKNVKNSGLSFSEEEVATALLEECPPVIPVGFPLKAEDFLKQSYDRKALLEGKKILVVDDDIRNIFAITTALENYQVEVLFAKNGREGITILQSNPDTDLVLMDIMMPDMDGFEAIQIIRKIPNIQKIPIIALTAKAMKYDREQCIEAGASDYISKPVNLEQLISIMRVWLYRSGGETFCDASFSGV